jgi:hypothetical protein
MISLILIVWEKEEEERGVTELPTRRQGIKT